MKTIILKQNGMGRYGDVSPFPMGDLEIELQGIPTYSGEFRFPCVLQQREVLREHGNGGK